MKKVLVTGATGFTGSHLVRRLLKEGYAVRAFIRKRSSKLPSGIEIVMGDLRDKDSIVKAVKGIDIIFHVAAQFQDYRAKDKVYWEVNVEGTKYLLEEALKNDIERFIHCSTVGVLGDVKEIPANEDTPPNPGDIYQITKYEAEKLALEYYKKHGLPVVVIRPAGIYGPGDMRLLKLFKLISENKFVMFGNGDKLYHLTYIDDLINGFILCATKKGIEGEIFIIAGEEPITVKELVKQISETLGVPYPRRRFPLFPVFVASILCEKICKLFGVSPPLFPRRLDFFRKNRAFSIEKAKKVLGYEPQIDLKTGLKRTIEWYKMNGYL
ncbi:hypothetical protein DRP07_11040 [Archaeoglobales archaeon]|nr:MAG: hypothetical protein DRP07_11040 [Archaeoglobales archaeon]